MSQIAEDLATKLGEDIGAAVKRYLELCEISVPGADAHMNLVKAFARESAYIVILAARDTKESRLAVLQALTLATASILKTAPMKKELFQ